MTVLYPITCFIFAYCKKLLRNPIRRFVGPGLVLNCLERLTHQQKTLEGSEF